MAVSVADQTLKFMAICKFTFCLPEWEGDEIREKLKFHWLNVWNSSCNRCVRDGTMRAFYIPRSFWNSVWNYKFGMPSFHEFTSLHVCKLIKIRVRRFNCSGLGHVRLWFYSWLFHVTCLWLARLVSWNISNLFVWNLGLQFISSFNTATSLEKLRSKYLIFCFTFFMWNRNYVSWTQETAVS